MVGAFNAVLYFLSQCQGQVDDQDTRLTESQVGQMLSLYTQSAISSTYVASGGFWGSYSAENIPD